MSQLSLFQEVIENQSLQSDLEPELWSQGYTKIAGVDEVGRGCLAGPVVACACILPSGIFPKNLADSKILTQEEREYIYNEFTSRVDSVYSVSIIDNQVIDSINILQASRLAMKNAVDSLRIQPQYVLVDGRDRLSIQLPQKAVIGGDAKSPSISLASIIAKVIRDKIMSDLSKTYVEYGFDRNKGYGTKQHLEALRIHGPTVMHRMTFAPVKNLSSLKCPSSQVYLVM